MPKELTHWMMARAAARQLDPGAAGRTNRAIAECPEAFLLGAIAHDGPFYLPKEARMANVAIKLHGRGADDVFAPIRRAIAVVPVGSPPAAPTIAFAAGALCHLAADTIFHPAVFFFTGFAAHPNPAVRNSYLFRHRGFESAMDLHFLSEHGDGIEPKAQVLWRQASSRPDFKELLATIARFYAADAEPFTEPDAARVLERAVGTQRLFFSPPARGLVRLLGLPKAGRNGDHSSLFYRRASEWDSHFTSPRPYRDPVTGTAGLFDARQFFDRAVTAALSLSACLERAIEGQSNAFPFPGPSLENGHPLNEEQEMQYCDPSLDRR